MVRKTLLLLLVLMSYNSYAYDLQEILVISTRLDINITVEGLDEINKDVPNDTLLLACYIQTQRSSDENSVYIATKYWIAQTICNVCRIKGCTIKERLLSRSGSVNNPEYAKRRFRLSPNYSGSASSYLIARSVLRGDVPNHFWYKAPPDVYYFHTTNCKNKNGSSTVAIFDNIEFRTI